VNEWIVAGAVLLAAVLPLQWVAFRGGPGEALAASQKWNGAIAPLTK
jgi:hypothetical protein